MKLTDIKVIYICPDHNEKYKERKKHMDTMLQLIGFKEIYHFVSSTEEYPDCLSISTIQLLQLFMDEPILVLEDDVEWTGLKDVEIDEHADAIYLGLSKNAAHPTENTSSGNAIFSYWSDSHVRLLNMLSAHAILYISRKYKEHIINLLSQNLGSKTYNDVIMARQQPHFTILATKKPYFFQSLYWNDKESNVEDMTRFEM
jgi:hypothetical protein